MSRFDYVKYDDLALHQQTVLKNNFEGVLALIEQLPDGRAKSLALTKLEEAYMWCGKAIRDEQIKRGNAEPQEDRKDG